MTRKLQTKRKKARITAKRSSPARTHAIKERLFETDATYLLKLVLLVLLGSFWLRLGHPMSWFGMPLGAIPAGLILGFLIVKLTEKYQSDRKIWYVVLVVVAIVTYGADKGIVV